MAQQRLRVHKSSPAGMHTVATPGNVPQQTLHQTYIPEDGPRQTQQICASGKKLRVATVQEVHARNAAPAFSTAALARKLPGLGPVLVQHCLALPLPMLPHRRAHLLATEQAVRVAALLTVHDLPFLDLRCSCARGLLSSACMLRMQLRHPLRPKET